MVATDPVQDIPHICIAVILFYLYVELIQMASATTSKRQRTANTTTAEKEILLGLVQKYQNVVENKKTDGVTTGQKDRAWQLIADEFNSFALLKRDVRHLKIVSRKWLKSRFLVLYAYIQGVTTYKYELLNCRNVWCYTNMDG